MLGKTRLEWTNWSLKHQEPEEEWSIPSPTTPSGKPNQQEGFTSQKPTTSSGRSESPLWWIAAFRQWSRMPLNQPGKPGLRVVVMDFAQAEAVTMPSRKSMDWLVLTKPRNGSSMQTSNRHSIMHLDAPLKNASSGTDQ